MASTIKVVIDVVADKAATSLKNFKSSLDDAEGGFGKLKAAGSGAMDGLKLHAGEFALAAGTAIVAFGAKAVGAFTGLALEADRFSDVAGIAVEDASRWIEVAGDIGVQGEAVQGAFQKMNKAIADGKLDEFTDSVVRAKDGTVDANATFQNLITKIGAIKDPTDRAAAAQKAFGKGYAEIAELMEMSAGDLKTALDGVSDAKVIDEKEVEKAKKFRAQMDELKDKAEDFALSLGEHLIPKLLGILEVVEKLEGPLGVLFDLNKQVAGAAELNAEQQAELDALYMEQYGHLPGLIKFVDELSASQAASTFEARAATAAMGDAEGATGDLGEEVEKTKRSYDKLKSSVDILKGALSNRDAEDKAIAAQNELIWANTVAMQTAQNQKASEEEKAAALDAAKEATRRSIDATIAYIDTLGGIPTEKATVIAAMIDAGSLDAVEEQLRILARNRQVDVQIVARGGAGYGPGGPRAAGGPVYPNTLHEVGEGGKPELLDAGGRTYLIPGNQGGMVRPASSGGSMGAAGMNVTINVSTLTGQIPPATIRQIEDALARSNRLNGRS